MHHDDQPESTALEELQQILLMAGLGIFVCLTTGLLAGIFYTPTP